MNTRKPYKFTSAALILILLLCHTPTTFAQSNKDSSPQTVRLTNVRDTQFTVSWITKRKTTAKINYGSTAGLGKTAYDDRGKGIQGRVHHITIRHLKPNTLYYFEIVSANKTYRKGKQLYTSHTGPSIIPANCDVAYGRVYKRLKRRHKQPYTKEAIVYLTIIDKDGAGSFGESAPESTILEDNSYWSRELANFREKALSPLFNYSVSGDALKIELETGLHPPKELIVDTSSDSPTKDIELIEQE